MDEVEGETGRENADLDAQSPRRRTRTRAVMEQLVGERRWGGHDS